MLVNKWSGMAVDQSRGVDTQSGNKRFQAFNNHVAALLPVHGDRVPRAKKIGAIIYNDGQQGKMSVDHHNGTTVFPNVVQLTGATAGGSLGIPRLAVYFLHHAEQDI